MLSLNDLGPVLAFSDALGEALYALDREWRVAAANEAALRWLGSDAIVGRLYWDLVPGARGTVVETAFRSAMAGRDRVDVEAESSVHPGRFARGVAIPLADGLAVSFRDVTEEHSANTERQRALAESEERLRLATEAASIGTWDVDATTGSRRWSARMRAILGIGEDVTADPKLFSALIDPRDRERVNALYRGAYAGDGEGRYATEFRIRRAGDGAERWISTRGRVFFDGDGRALRAIGAIIDVTERKLAEEALRDSEEMFRGLAEALPQIVWMMRASDGRATYTNQRFLDYHGGPVGAELGERSSNLHPDDRAQALATRDASVAAGLPFELDVRVRRHDGQYRWHRMSCVPLARDGEVRSYIGTATDIHDMRVAAEQEQLLIHELNHRVKNTLATVQSIAVQTFRGAEARRARGRRLRGAAPGAVAGARRADPRELGGRRPARDRRPGDRAVRGERVGAVLDPRTRAAPEAEGRARARDGAAGARHQRRQIGRAVEQRRPGPDPLDARARADAFLLDRARRPAGRAADRRGFGSRLIERTLAQDLNGEVAVSFEREGVVCAVAAPLQ